MSDTVIRVENLGKKYALGEHKDGGYTTLREKITEKAKSLGRKVLLHSGKSVPHPSAYEEFWSLKNVSFDVKQGEVVGIIGHNGAGKSTLLKVLSRITEPTTGKITIKGRVASLLEVGTGFHPELTGRENIYLNGAILGMSKVEIKKNFDQIVAFSEVEKFLDTPVKRYSSGMYVRLAFAVAAHLEPEILIIDEVLAVGDATFQKKCLGKMQNVAGEGRTVIFVSHNMGAVRGLCSKTLWLNGGQLLMSGATANVIDSYLKTTLDSAGMIFDLHSIKRVRGEYGQQLRLCKIEFNGGEPILHGEPLHVRMFYETYAEVHDVSFGFGFSNYDGVRLMSVDSDLLGTRRDIAKAANGVVEVKLEQLLLQPGRYTLDVGARSGDNYALDYLSGCAQIDVLPGPSTPATIIRDTGGVRIPALWNC